jgi:cysteinyl-tRNA synthetase
MSAVAMGAPEALAEAESLREEDPSAAIQLTYTTLREAIAERVASDASVTATHREFLASVHDQLPTAEAFATVTDTFEQATFSASEVTAEDAEVVLNHAESILSAQSLRSDGGSEADEHDQ